MEAVPSGSFLKEFTLVADRAAEEGETFLIERKNGRDVVLLSLDAYNELRRSLYEARRARDCHD